ncbi:MAG: energy-coupling factor ABC transporter ATP-binding protein [Oscillospiraceae bacterium]|nr:energy-coupling factor ABC transporter ATP-binding protein [Oscillospiraceae bacterium]
MIMIENVTYRYPGSAKPVLSGFSAYFDRGEIVAVRGKNGIGKTTLTKLLTGMLRPQTGRILINGADISGMDLFEIGQKIGYVFQNPNRQLFRDTVYNETAYGLKNMGLNNEQTERRATRYLDYFGLASYRDDYPGKLSFGEKQRLALAAVLALGTDYLVLDEPTAGLDVYRRRELGDMLKNLRRDTDCGVVFVSHEADFIARTADRELVMAL